MMRNQKEQSSMPQKVSMSSNLPARFTFMVLVSPVGPYYGGSVPCKLVDEPPSFEHGFC